METTDTPVKNTSILPDSHLDLLTEKKAFAHLATKNVDGSLQSTPVWIDFDSEFAIVNTARGRRKDENMKERPQVAISIHDPDDPYRYLEIRGKVAKETENGAWDHIHKMAQKYLGKETYPYAKPENEDRVLFKIKPEGYSTHEQ